MGWESAACTPPLHVMLLACIGAVVLTCIGWLVVVAVLGLLGFEGGDGEV